MSRVLEAVQEELAELRARIARLERIEAELCDEDAAPAGRARKPLLLPKARKPAKREGKQRRPPAGGRRAETRARLHEQLRALLAKDPDISANEARQKVGCSWHLAKEVLAELTA